ncbi:MAG: response regulator [Acidobacteria bacterium]|nr:response regulator [Acidobacteriota bacterium]
MVGQDVTTRVEAEEELRRNREVLMNQERLKAVGELASGIAHDLNNSLNALRLWLEVLCADPTVTSRHDNALQLISRIVRDASATIGRLQDFARRRHDRPVESVDLNAIIGESVQMAKSTLEEKNLLLGKSIRVELELPKLPLVFGDPSELRQLILNLLLNAQDAMPAGGTIRISGQVEHELIAVRVEDEGYGIPQQHLNRIFDPFFSTKGERGTGLGLSIAYAAMTRIGGSISAANRVEGGAIFTLNFPIAYLTSIRNTQQSASEIQPLRVMVADDDANNREAFKTFLESRGHKVITASSGPQTLEKLIDENVPVDVIFCDLGMPLMNGWEVARRVKSLQMPPAFFLVTGWAAEIPPNHADRKLVDAVIAKPVDLKAIDQLLADISPTSGPSGQKRMALGLVRGNGLDDR